MRPGYTPFYCEENVWHLCQELLAQGRDCCAVFVSNPQKICPLWHQRAAPEPGQPVLWDYHVIALEWAAGGTVEVKKSCWVMDMDTLLGCPIPLDDYLHATFGAPGLIPEPYRPWFRVVEASAFVRRFASDRSHMRLPDGRWSQPPPPWPIIQGPEATAPTNLMRFVDMEQPFVGQVVERAGLVALRPGSQPA